MEKPVYLKQILNILFYVLIVFEILALAALLYSLFNPEHLIPVKYSSEGLQFEDYSHSKILKVIYLMIIGGVFIASIYFMKRLVENFMRNEMFSIDQTQNLRAIGNLILIYTVSDAIIPFLMRIVTEGDVNINLGVDLSYGSFWFHLALGLLFQYLSQVFENARKLKEENDYTV